MAKVFSDSDTYGCGLTIGICVLRDRSCDEFFVVGTEKYADLFLLGDSEPTSSGEEVVLSSIQEYVNWMCVEEIG
jgi:hypothetical protein